MDHRYRLLDHWRGFAALWVMAFHAVNVWLIARPDLLPPVLAWICAHGWLGAHVFFVVSGYCIAERLAREYQGDRSVRRFVLDRLLRIYPPYWAALAFAFALALLAGVFNGGRSAFEGGAGQWLAAIFAAEHWLALPGYLLVAWTLSFEIGFYLLAALCLAVALQTKRPWAGGALAVVFCAAGLTPAIASRLPLLSLWPHFALGSLVWLLLRQPSVTRRLLWGALLLGALAVFARTMPDNHGRPLLFVTGCAGLLLVLRPFDARLAAAPALRWVAWAGTISYSLYLIHAPVVGKFRNALARRWPPGEPGALWIPLAACALAVAISWVFYHLVELRTEQWRKNCLRQPRLPELSP